MKVVLTIYKNIHVLVYGIRLRILDMNLIKLDLTSSCRFYMTHTHYYISNNTWITRNRNIKTSF